jgi:adenylosuccinate lyase
MIGRTHGIHAEPTTFGAKVALWALQIDRDRARLQAARRAIGVCKLSGAVGTYSNIDPAVESYVGERLGLEPVPATQVISRDRHAEYLWACAAVGSTMELMAVELRHLQRTEVGEVQEGFKPNQKGSSAMPHKRNPISAETITVARAARQPPGGMQDVALWYERDIRTVRRTILPDSSLMACYVLRRMQRLLAGLQAFLIDARTRIDARSGVQPTCAAGPVHGGLDRTRRTASCRTMRRGLSEQYRSGKFDADPRRRETGVADEAFDLSGLCNTLTSLQR